MDHHEHTEVLARLLDTDPVTHRSRAATVKFYVRHLADTV